MFLAGETFLLVVVNQSGSALARDLDERDAGIVDPDGRHAGNISGLAAFDLFLDG